MPIQRFENIDLNQNTLTQDGVGGGGGTLPIGNTNTNFLNDEVSASNNITFSNLFVFDISSNESTFTTLVNGEVVANSKELRITRDSLSKEAKKIEIKKDGFVNNEYYIVEMINDNIPIIDNPKIDRPLGISTKDIVVTKYSNGRVVSPATSIKNKVSFSLEFTLRKSTNIDDSIKTSSNFKVTFKISGVGSPVSILKNSNKNAEFFPKTGVSEYEDVDGTKYTIRSSDTTLHRITRIFWNGKEFLANVGESLELDVTLKDNYTFDIQTEEVFRGTPALDPKIQLVKTDARTYNINSKAGVPLMFRKNADVQAITVIVGDDVLEFDDLDKGDLCGITIPHNVFKNIGKYNIKIFPFSFDEYEQQVRPVQKADIVETKKVTTKFDVKEETKLPDVNLSDRFNPYTPISTGGSGGGGGRPVVIVDEQTNQDNINPFTNRGDFVNRPVDNRNIR